MKTDSHDEWPERPETWPAVMDEIMVCQYLLLDRDRSIESARRTLRHIRRSAGLRSIGRVGRRVLFRRETVETWLADREARQVPTNSGFTTAENED